MGLIPIHVYEIQPWVPFQSLYEEHWGYMTNVDGLLDLMEKLKNTSAEEFARREESIALYRDSHFSSAGVMKHIREFMTTGGGQGE